MEPAASLASVLLGLGVDREFSQKRQILQIHKIQQILSEALSGEAVFGSTPSSEVHSSPQSAKLPTGNFGRSNIDAKSDEKRRRRRRFRRCHRLRRNVTSQNWCSHFCCAPCGCAIHVLCSVPASTILGLIKWTQEAALKMRCHFDATCYGRISLSVAVGGRDDANLRHGHDRDARV